MFGRIGTAISILTLGLLSPYRSAMPYPFQMYDSVYSSYVSNVGLAVLAVLDFESSLINEKGRRISDIFERNYYFWAQKQTIVTLKNTNHTTI